VVTRPPSVLSAILLCGALASACSASPPPEPMTLKGGMLTVDNRTRQNWANVEVWLNTHYRMQFRDIPAGGRMQAPLDFFVAGYGQHFNFNKQQVRDLRLTAKLPDGKPLEVKKEFELDGLDSVLRDMAKKK
jgi:hypothetical protein